MRFVEDALACVLAARALDNVKAEHELWNMPVQWVDEVGPLWKVARKWITGQKNAAKRLYIERELESRGVDGDPDDLDSWISEETVHVAANTLAGAHGGIKHVEEQDGLGISFLFNDGCVISWGTHPGNERMFGRFWSSAWEGTCKTQQEPVTRLDTPMAVGYEPATQRLAGKRDDSVGQCRIGRVHSFTSLADELGGGLPDSWLVSEAERGEPSGD